MADEFIEPTTHGRVKLLAFYVSGIALSLVMDRWWHPFMDYVQSLSICDQLPWLRALIIFFASGFVLSAFTLARHAQRMLKLRQSPLPEAVVLWRTAVRRGWSVTGEAYALLFMAALLAVAPIAGWIGLEMSSFFWGIDSCASS